MSYYTNVGSSKSDVKKHCKTMQHTRNVQEKIVGLLSGSQRGVQLLQCITDCNLSVVNSQTDEQEPAGFTLVPETVQVIRTEFF